MKKIWLFIIFMLICSSLFATKNVGSYALDDIDNKAAKSFTKYMKDNDYLEEYAFYGIDIIDDDIWALYLGDESDYGPIVIGFYGDSIYIIRWAYVDLSSNSLLSILSLVNQENIAMKTFGTLLYNPEDSDLGYSLVLTSRQMNNATLKAELDKFYLLSGICFDDVTESLN